MKIRIGIIGYGNLGKGVEQAISQNPDMELVAVFTRRTPDSINCNVQVDHYSNIENYKDRIDVMILCGGSATDLPLQVPEVSKYFNTVDSFDTHAKIPEYYQTVNESALRHGKLSLISTGWDPGLFSLARLIGRSVLPDGSDYTFWGKGLSQGHSDAIRRLKGVKYAAQYTIPLDDALHRVRAGESPEFTTAEKHKRVCYVVLNDEKDTVRIEHEIKTMPHYFADYNTEVHFISEEDFLENHTKMPHGGIVFRTGRSAAGSKHKIEFSLELESNPEFTSSILVACARAVARMANQGQTGAISLFDIPPILLSAKKREDLMRDIL